MPEYLKMSEAPNKHYLKGWNDCLAELERETPEAVVMGNKTITDSEWITRYRPINEEVLIDYPIKYPVNQIWTQVEGDDGEIVVCAGSHVVNRLGYWITEVEHNFDVEVIDD